MTTPFLIRGAALYDMEHAIGNVIDALTNAGARKYETNALEGHFRVLGYWVVDMIRIDITGIPNSKEETPHE